MGVQCHEHEGAGLLLHAPELAASVAGYPALAVIRDVHLCDIFPLVHIFDSDTAPALQKQPFYELSAAIALLQRSCEKGYVAHILKDAARRSAKFFSGAAFLAECIAQLVIFENHAVRIEAFAVAGLFTETSSELARSFGFHGTHDLQLCSTATSLVPTDDQHLCAALT